MKIKKIKNQGTPQYKLNAIRDAIFFLVARIASCRRLLVVMAVPSF